MSGCELFRQRSCAGGRGSRPSAYVGIVGLRVWTPTGELGISIPRGSRPSNRVGIVETYNYKHEIVLLA